MFQIADQAPTWVEITNVFVSIADIVATIIVGIIVAFLANSYRRQQAVRVGEKRLAAYQVLWSRMEVASPYRQTVWSSAPLKKEEMKHLFNAFTDWYYENGNGMYMGGSTRAIYLKAKDNLIREPKYYKPELIRKELEKLTPEEQERARGYLSIRQLSLLRNSMKAELDVFGILYHISLNKWDKEFLNACAEDLTSKKPWNEDKQDPVRSNQEVEIFPSNSVQLKTES
jgi:hypothetical protein